MWHPSFRVKARLDALEELHDCIWLVGGLVGFWTDWDGEGERRRFSQPGT